MVKSDGPMHLLYFPVDSKVITTSEWKSFVSQRSSSGSRPRD
jgi:hypothetical protein